MKVFLVIVDDSKCLMDKHMLDEFKNGVEHISQKSYNYETTIKEIGKDDLE